MSRILVVEDEPTIADAVEYALSTEGMTVVLITHKVGSAKYSHVGLPCICLRIPLGFEKEKTFAPFRLLNFVGNEQGLMVVRANTQHAA
jgi:hypothetical protein